MAGECDMTTVYAILAKPSTRYSSKNLVVVAGATVLLALSAKIQIPFYPVPMTMQVLVVLGLGIAMGWRLALLSILAYLAEGAIGLPVFAGTPEKGIGLAYMAGPTGGYLLGFLLAATTCGVLAERGWDRSMPLCLVAAMIGIVLIYLPGVLWLGVLFGWDKPLIEWGMAPFILGDILKVAILAVGFPMMRRHFG